MDVREILVESCGCIQHYQQAWSGLNWIAWSVFWEPGWKASNSALDSWSSQQWQQQGALHPTPLHQILKTASVIRKQLRFPSIPEAWTWRMALFWAAVETCHSLPERMNKASWQGCTTGTLWLPSQPLASWICIASHPVTSPLTYLSYTPSPLSISFTSSPTPILVLTLFSCMFHVSRNLLYIATLPLAQYLHCISLYVIPFFLCGSLFWDFLVPEDGSISLLWNAGNSLHKYMLSHPCCGVRIWYLDLTTDFSLPQPTVEDDFRCSSEDKTELVIQCNNYRHTRESEGSCK